MGKKFTYFTYMKGMAKATDCVKNVNSQVWWCTPVIPVLGRLRQEDCRFKASLGNLVRPHFKIKIKRAGDIAQR